MHCESTVGTERIRPACAEVIAPRCPGSRGGRGGGNQAPRHRRRSQATTNAPSQLSPESPAAEQPSPPFTAAQWEKHGFEVKAIDVDDTAAARTLARALRWNEGEDAMDIEGDLFAWYTVLVRR